MFTNNIKPEKPRAWSKMILSLRSPEHGHHDWPTHLRAATEWGKKQWIPNKPLWKISDGAHSFMISDEENQLPSNEASYTCVGSLEPDLNHCACIISPAKTVAHGGLKEGCRGCKCNHGRWVHRAQRRSPCSEQKAKPWGRQHFCITRGCVWRSGDVFAQVLSFDGLEIQ